MASMNLGKFAKLMMITWLILHPGELLDGLDGQRRAAEGVGGVDLVRAVAGDRDERVARDRQPAGDAAADPPQHQRVRPAAGVVRVGARLVRRPRAAGRCRSPARCRPRSACSARGERAWASDGIAADCVEALIMNSTNDSSSQATSRRPAARITRFGVIRRPGPPRSCRRLGSVRYSAGPPELVVLAAQARLQALRGRSGRACTGAVRDRWACTHIVTACRAGAPSASTWAVRSCWPARSIPGSRSTTAPSAASTASTSPTCSTSWSTRSRRRATAPAARSTRSASEFRRLIDQRTGNAVIAVNLPLKDIMFADVMAERLGLPVFVDNDANLRRARRAPRRRRARRATRRCC